MITKKAYAKLNLVLDVTGKRADGYHLIRTVMHTIDLADDLTFSKNDGERNLLFLEKDSIVSEDALSLKKDNLILRAANLMQERFALPQKADIRLRKKIPLAAGMAGGSADAAATLLGLNELFCCNATQEELQEMALQLGADVPYCLRGGCALAEGIGEELTMLPSLEGVPVVIAKPEGGISTADIYRRLDAVKDPEHPPVDAAVEAIRKKDIPSLALAAGNILEAVCRQSVPVIGEIEKSLIEEGAQISRMTGSGPTVFGIFADTEQAEKAAKALKASFPDLFVAATGLL
ncbi:MAG: 4-(cytidine 5'-diphospho)-2-C-methyl-D-erythritol kinase [Lachnospiraceae bacterium]|nr:4-(cytidine 5'-diphospho)-2-C-methyl-D-erythritol kinase [Lachnospiraceae bacterium]MBP3736018.1 4-(cytidine 5'-diphospho)-2-C-methyl-D-erythritol kinase [Lachnospiraceae bacterium]